MLRSASLSATSRHPRTYSGGADGGGGDLRRANCTGSKSNNNNNEVDSLPLQLIVEEKATDEGVVWSPPMGGGLGKRG